MKKILLSILTFIFVSNIAIASEHVQNLSADEALKKLKEGNKNFVEMKMKHPDISKTRRIEMLNGQNPFVAILSCSDSRVPPEIIFDQGLGDIFEIRNAGNVVNEHVIGSIEYAVYHLGVKLVVIMGHQNCGAVGAALSSEKESKYIEDLKKAIEPAVRTCKKQNRLSYENVIKENIKHDIQMISQKDEKLANYMKEHDVKVVQAYYNLNTGEVEFYE